MSDTQIQALRARAQICRQQEAICEYSSDNRIARQWVDWMRKADALEAEIAALEREQAA